MSSLIVSMEVVKFQLGTFINYDLGMYNAPNDTPASARTSSLIEELGQVEYVFSDKTGTLTENKMILKKISVSNQSFSEVPKSQRSNNDNFDEPASPTSDTNALNDIEMDGDDGGEGVRTTLVRFFFFFLFLFFFSFANNLLVPCVHPRPSKHLTTCSQSSSWIPVIPNARWCTFS